MDLFTELQQAEFIARMACIYTALRGGEHTSTELLTACNAHLSDATRFKNAQELRQFAHMHLPEDCIRKQGRGYTYRLRNSLPVTELAEMIRTYGDHLQWNTGTEVVLSCRLMCTRHAYNGALDRARLAGFIAIRNNTISLISAHEEARNG